VITQKNELTDFDNIYIFYTKLRLVRCSRSWIKVKIKSRSHFYEVRYCDLHRPNDAPISPYRNIIQLPSNSNSLTAAAVVVCMSL